MLTDWFVYTNMELSALKYHHTEEKKKMTIITVFQLDEGRRASAGGVLQNREQCVVSGSDM